jgi:hypothetical protein
MKHMTLKRALTLLASSIVMLVLVLAGQAYAAGAVPSLAVGPPGQNIYLYVDRRADWQWVAACSDGGVVSIREYVGQWGNYNNFPGLAGNVQRAAYWYYDPYYVPSTFQNRWYGECGTWIAPRYYRLSTWVYGN